MALAALGLLVLLTMGAMAHSLNATYVLEPDTNGATTRTLQRGRDDGDVGVRNKPLEDQIDNEDEAGRRGEDAGKRDDGEQREEGDGDEDEAGSTRDAQEGVSAGSRFGGSMIPMQ